MYERTISFYTFSKTYAMTGLRLGYVAAKDAKLRDRMKKALFYTASNVASVVQFGGIGALEGSQALRRGVPRRAARRGATCSTQGIREHAGDVLSGEPPKGAFYAFLRINPDWVPPSGKRGESLSWAMTEHLIAEGRDRLRARRGLRRARRGLSALLLRARSPGAERRAGIDGRAVRRCDSGSQSASRLEQQVRVRDVTHDERARTRGPAHQGAGVIGPEPGSAGAGSTDRSCTTQLHAR